MAVPRTCSEGVAAKWEDALFCLRYCIKPDNLCTSQLLRILEFLPQNLRNTNNYVAADMIAALCIATKCDTLQEIMSSRDRICSPSADGFASAGLFPQCPPGTESIQKGLSDRHRCHATQGSSRKCSIQAGKAVSILPYASPYQYDGSSRDSHSTTSHLEGSRQKSPAVVGPAGPNQLDKLANRMGLNR